MNPQSPVVGRRCRATTREGDQVYGAVLRLDESGPRPRRLVIQADDGRVLVDRDVKGFSFMTGKAWRPSVLRFRVEVAVTSTAERPAAVAEYVRQAFRMIDLPLSEGNARVAVIDYIDPGDEDAG